jgi:predicted nucleic-acid-binding Zn-ribbon protein
VTQNDSVDPTDEQIMGNFKDTKFTCIKCGSKNVTVKGPRVRVGELEDEQIGILEQYFRVNQTVNRTARYILASIDCSDCKNQSFVTINLLKFEQN